MKKLVKKKFFSKINKKNFEITKKFILNSSVKGQMQTELGSMDDDELNL
jgi:hypothetical protein